MPDGSLVRAAIGHLHVMKCARCGVEIDKGSGYIEIIAYGNVSRSMVDVPARIQTAFCTWFCAAVAMDLCALKALETVATVQEMPQCRSWLAEHNHGA